MASSAVNLTAKQAAARLGVSASTLDRLVASGALPFHRYRAHGHRRFSSADLQTYLASTRVNAPTAIEETPRPVTYGRNVDHLMPSVREFE